MSNATAAVKMKRHSRRLNRFLWRLCLSLVTFLVLSLAALALAANLIFTGPSPTARNMLTHSLSQSPLTQWIPEAFLGEEMTASILRQAEGG